MMKVRGYCRSFEESLPNILIQEKQIRDHCTYKNYELVKIYSDINTQGKTFIRPSLQSCVADIKTGECIMFSTLPIFSETIRDVLTLFDNLRSKGVHIICLERDLDSTSPIGNMIINSFVYLYSLEKNANGKNISAAIQKKTSEGKTRTRAPFGYKFISKDQDLEPIPEQLRIIEKIKTLYAKEKCLNRVAKQLNADGDNIYLGLNQKTPPTDIRTFRAQQIQRILVDHGVITKGQNSRMSIQKRILAPNSSISANSSANSLSTASTSANPVTINTSFATNSFLPPQNNSQVHTIIIPNNIHSLPSVPNVPSVPQVPQFSSTGALPPVNNTQIKPISIPIATCSSEDECSESDSD